MSNRTLRGKTAVVGVGETTYYKHGQSPDPEFVLVLQAILKACEDAGINPKEIDGFASYSNDRNEPTRIAAALGIDDLRYSNMNWGGGGGGVAAAIGNAAAAVAVGFADCVVAFRGLAQGQFQRFGKAPPVTAVSGDPAYMSPYGVMSPLQKYAMRAMRFMHENKVDHSVLRAISMASYHHAQNNPRAVMYGRPLSEEKYDDSRWIAEPCRLFDCCQENDGAAAVIMVSAEKAKDMKRKPAYILWAAQGSDHRCGAPVMNASNFPSSSFASLAPRLYEMAGIAPKDVDVVQSYENFTIGVMMAVVEHGFCEPEECNEFFQLENLTAPGGKMPLNTSGGNLAECYMHGLGLQIEAVRQIRGDSANQVPGADVALNIAGPMVHHVSTAILGSEATL